MGSRLGNFFSTRAGGLVIVLFGVLASWSPAYATVCTPSELNPCSGQALIDLTGTNNGANNAGVYTSPYTGTITPYLGTAVPTVMICDDYYDNSYLGESWVANVTQASTLTSPSGTVLYDGSDSLYGNAIGGISQAQEYTAVAYMATQIADIYSEELTASSSQKSTLETEAGNWGFALWDFTNTGVGNGSDPPSNSCVPGETASYCLSNSDNTVLSGLSGGTTEVTTVMGYISQALTVTADQTPANYSNVTIYSYAGEGTSCSGNCPPPPQEFVTVSMDEPSMPLLLGFYGICAIGLGFAFRRRIANKLG